MPTYRLDGVALSKAKLVMFKVAQGKADDHECELVGQCCRLAWDSMNGNGSVPTPFAFTVWFYSHLYCSLTDCTVTADVVRGIAKWVSEHSNLLCDPELMFSAAVDVMNSTEAVIAEAHDAAVENGRALAEAGERVKSDSVLRAALDDLVRDNEKLIARLKAAQDQLARMKEAVDMLRRQVEVDQLTQVMNRRGFDERLAAAVKAAQLTKVPVSLVMVDVDHFKRVNDTYGHKAGDAVLYHVAQLLKGAVRPVDVVARYGGEEFAVVLKNTTEDEAKSIAERMRRALERSHVVHGGRVIRVTASFGVAVLKPDDTPETFVQRADEALYAAKNSGRNRVVSESEAALMRVAQKQEEKQHRTPQIEFADERHERMRRKQGRRPSPPA